MNITIAIQKMGLKSNFKTLLRKILRRKYSNGYPLFVKLLGMFVSYPEMQQEQLNEQTFYNTINYYRSHIEEIFYCNSVRPLPPVQGICIMFFHDTDELSIVYHLCNKSDTPVKVGLSWYSLPDYGVDFYASGLPNGFIFGNTQREHTDYNSYAALLCADRQISFSRNTQKFESEPIEEKIDAHKKISISFQVKFTFSQQNKPFVCKQVNLAHSIKKLEDIYSRLPNIPDRFKEFEKLALNAAGTLNSLKCYEMWKGGRVESIHPGKGALGCTYFWDGAFTLLALDLLKEYKVIRGMTDILCAGIDNTGKPSSHYLFNRHFSGYNQPILAWGINHLNRQYIPKKSLMNWYSSLARYVAHWLYDIQKGEIGALGWDDALRWQDKFPITFFHNEKWADKDWGVSKSHLFEAPDTNSYLYLECLSLAEIASYLGMNSDKNLVA